MEGKLQDGIQETESAKRAEDYAHTSEALKSTTMTAVVQEALLELSSVLFAAALSSASAS